MNGHISQIILVLLFFVGVVLLMEYQEGNPEKYENLKPEVCSEIQEISLKNTCYALTKKNSSFCELQEGYSRDMCYRYLAVIKKDSLICREIESRDKRDSCYIDVAEIVKDYSLCEKVGARKDACYYKVAVATSNSDVCSKMLEGFGANNKDACYAITTKDTSFCESLSEEGSYVSSMCYYGVAVAKKDSLICESVDSSYKPQCYSDIAILKGDFSLCENAQYTYSGKKEGKEACYLSVSLINPNLAICDKIQTPDFKNICYALNEEDSSSCKGIEQLDVKDYCYFYSAIIKEDFHICKGIQEGELKDRCYYLIATNGDILERILSIRVYDVL